MQGNQKQPIYLALSGAGRGQGLITKQRVTRHFWGRGWLGGFAKTWRIKARVLP